MNLVYVEINNQKKYVNVAEYEKGYYRNSITAKCAICNQPLSLCATSSISVKTHFKHFKNTICPSIPISREKYQHLQYANIDKQHAELIKLQLKNIETLYQIYFECKRLCNNKLYYSEFIELFKLANTRNIWAYANLELTHIPYCLLTLKLVFLNAENQDRKNNLFFIFDKQEIISNTIFIYFDELDLRLLKYKKINDERAEYIESFSINNNNYLMKKNTPTENAKKELSKIMDLL